MCVMDDCLDLSTDPPDFSVSCIGHCTATACADVQFLIDQIVDCAIWVFILGGELEDVLDECSEEVSACLEATC